MDPNQLWVPMIPVQIVGLLAPFGVAYYLGRKEKVRLAGLADGGHVEVAGGAAGDSGSRPVPSSQIQDNGEDLTRPKLFWVNLTLMVATIAILVSAILPPSSSS